MVGVHSGGVGTILLYIECPVRGAAHYMGGESIKLGYIEGVSPHTFPTMGNPGYPHTVPFLRSEKLFFY